MVFSGGSSLWMSIIFLLICSPPSSFGNACSNDILSVGVGFIGSINNRTKAYCATGTATKNKNNSEIRISNRSRITTGHHRAVPENDVRMSSKFSSLVGFPWWCQRRRRRDGNQRHVAGENAQKQREDYQFLPKLSTSHYNEGCNHSFRSIGKVPLHSRIRANSDTRNIPTALHMSAPLSSSAQGETKNRPSMPFAIIQRIVGMLIMERKNGDVYLPDTHITDNDISQQELNDQLSNEESMHMKGNMDSISTPYPHSTSQRGEDEPNNDGDKEKENRPYYLSSMQEKLTHVVQKVQDRRNKEKQDFSIDSCGDDESESSEEINNRGNATAVTLHTYQYPPNNPNITLYGLGVSLPKFKAWIVYMLENNHTINSTKSATALLDIHTQKLTHHKDSKEIYKHISTKSIQLDAEKRKELRREWFARNLISHRTEVLASYPSNQVNESSGNELVDKAPAALQEDPTNQSDTGKKHKRGGFNDLLSVYAERLVSILKDEKKDFESGLLKAGHEPKLNTNIGKPLRIGESSQKEYNTKSGRNQNKPVSSSSTKPSFHLISWLRSEYGVSQTNQLLHSNFSTLQEEEQLKTLKHFLNWFRENFPYYYDQCGQCNASFRNDEDANALADEADIDDSDNGVMDGTFLGYIYPTEDEIQGKASRTELYQCHKCHSYTRFPRYNFIPSIVQYGKGRCGEYSILLYRTLRDLGFHARWVVDWSDHVWVECWIGEEDLVLGDGRWIHLDPCEAACDEPLLYQQWGKKQTLIMAFWVPQQHKMYGEIDSDHMLLQQEGLPLIEDVTQKYTSDSIEVIESRREELSNIIQQSIETVETTLREKVCIFTKQKYQLE